MHVLLLTDAKPETTERFKKWVGQLDYPFEGKIRKGTNTPYLSEVKLFDIRIKKECAPAFLRDLQPIKQHSFVGKLPYVLQKLVFRFTKIHNKIVGNKGCPTNPFNEQMYSFVLGEVDDWHNRKGQEVL